MLDELELFWELLTWICNHHRLPRRTFVINSSCVYVKAFVQEKLVKRFFIITYSSLVLLIFCFCVFCRNFKIILFCPFMCASGRIKYHQIDITKNILMTWVLIWVLRFITSKHAFVICVLFNQLFCRALWEFYIYVS